MSTGVILSNLKGTTYQDSNETIKGSSWLALSEQAHRGPTYYMSDSCELPLRVAILLALTHLTLSISIYLMLHLSLPPCAARDFDHDSYLINARYDMSDIPALYVTFIKEHSRHLR